MAADEDMIDANGALPDHQLPPPSTAPPTLPPPSLPPPGATIVTDINRMEKKSTRFGGASYEKAVTVQATGNGYCDA